MSEIELKNEKLINELVKKFNGMEIVHASYVLDQVRWIIRNKSLVTVPDHELEKSV
jgi:hypothetical protein